MAVSSNAIIHYTRVLSNLNSILSEKSFRLKYCLEKISFNDGSFEFAVPMVSFCDIPFNNIEKHTNEYGPYGIGMKKAWAKSKNINPVVYLEKNSILTKHYSSLFDIILDIDEKTTKTNWQLNKTLDHFWGILSFTKNYSGDLLIRRDNRRIKGYNFYNEREWRYVCTDKKILDQFLTGDEYSLEKDKLNKKAFEIKLDFSEDDISYIVLNHQSQIPRIISYIKNNTDLSIDSLCSKFITLEQIKNDF